MAGQVQQTRAHRNTGGVFNKIHSEAAGLEYREITAYAAGLISKDPPPISKFSGGIRRLGTVSWRPPRLRPLPLLSRSPVGTFCWSERGRIPAPTHRSNKQGPSASNSCLLRPRGGLRPSHGLHKAASRQTSRYDGRRPTALSGSGGVTAGRLRGEEPACTCHSKAQRLRPRGTRDCALHCAALSFTRLIWGSPSCYTSGAAKSPRCVTSWNSPD